METMAQEWIEEGKEIGIEIGEVRGEARGELIAQRQTLLRLLAKRFPETLEQTARFAAYFEQIANFADLVQLIDHLLLVPTLAAFEEQLQPFLPKR